MQYTPPHCSVCPWDIKEVRGSSFGPPRAARTKNRIAVGGKPVVPLLFVTCFDAEKDRYPYRDGPFSNRPVASRFFEHLLHVRPLRWNESRALRSRRATLILTTPRPPGSPPWLARWSRAALRSF